jgi:RNA 2',3'-cyclic 3'-phosphodiesterase
MRTFIAIDLPGVLKTEIKLLQQKIQAAVQPFPAQRHLRWVAPDKIHLTLRFLGETTPAQRAEVTASLGEVAAASASFHLHLAGIGVFPSWPRMRVLWTGVGGDVAELKALQAATEKIAQQTGFAAEQKSYAPHITLARVDRNAAAADLRQLGEFLKSWAGEAGSERWGEWRVDELVYMHSQLRSEGALYTPLAHLPFKR